MGDDMRAWRNAAIALGFVAALGACASSQTATVTSQALVDPPRNEAHPAANRQLLIPSHGEEMNAVFFLAAGEGLKPTVLLMHGLPGNERNLDLAQAMRRAGWNVLTFTYRGAWGSTGAFSIGNAVEDTRAALEYVRRPEVAARYGVDTSHVVLVGHSMGGFAAAMVGADDPAVAGIILLDAWNVGASVAQIRQSGAEGRGAAIASLDDLGHALSGASAETLIDEALASTSAWDLTTHADALARHPVLVVYATQGIAEDNRALVAAIQAQPGARTDVVAFETDHAFADHRIALSVAVVDWLEQLD
jgi:uncharacterized protein